MTMQSKVLAAKNDFANGTPATFFTMPEGHIYHGAILVTNKSANVGTLNIKRTRGGQDYLMCSYNTPLNSGPAIVIPTFPYEFGDAVTATITGTTADLQLFGNDEVLSV